MTTIEFVLLFFVFKLKIGGNEWFANRIALSFVTYEMCIKSKIVFFFFIYLMSVLFFFLKSGHVIVCLIVAYVPSIKIAIVPFCLGQIAVIKGRLRQMNILVDANVFTVPQ